jgi:hypothetical protein
MAASISGIDAKRFPFMVSFSFGKSQKSQGGKSVDYGGCGHTVIFFVRQELMDEKGSVARSIVVVQHEIIRQLLRTFSAYIVL